jgi:hypothetical protein
LQLYIKGHNKTCLKVFYYPIFFWQVNFILATQSTSMIQSYKKLSKGISAQNQI